jgi:hypothetical protein
MTARRAELVLGILRARASSTIQIHVSQKSTLPVPALNMSRAFVGDGSLTHTNTPCDAPNAPAWSTKYSYLARFPSETLL